VADTTRTIKARFAGDSTGLEHAAGRSERALRNLDRAAGRSGRGFVSASVGVGRFRAGLGSAVGGVGRAVPVVGAAVVGLGYLGKRVLDTAVNLEAMDRKSRVVFGSSFPQLTKWAGRVNERMGLTTRQVLAMTAGFADMLIPMGLTRGKAAQLAQQFAKMAPVLSEWSNGQFTTREAAEALTGALTGEYDTLQRLGVPISDALVQHEALRLGLVKGKVDTDALSIAQQRAALAQTRYNKAVAEHGRGSDEARRASLALQVAQNGVEKATKGSAGEISAAAKAQAALSLIMRGSADAQRAYAANTGSLAARVNVAKARIGELRDQLIVKTTPWLTTAFTWFNDNWPEIGLGMVTIARVGGGLIIALAGVAAAGLYVGSALLYAAGAAAFARGNLAMGRELFATARGLQDSAGKAIDFGNAIQSKTNPMLDAMEAKLNAAKAAADRLPKSKVIFTSAPGAVRSAAEINTVRFAAAQLPGSKTVNINIRSNAVSMVAQIRGALNSIKDRTTYFTTVLRTVRAAEQFPSGGHAAGTAGAAPGWKWVGERGRELMWFGGGEKVLPSDLSNRLAGFLGGSAAAAGGGGTVTVELVSRDPLLQSLLALVDARVTARDTAAARRFRTRAGAR